MATAKEVSQSLEEAGISLVEQAKITGVKITVPSFSFVADLRITHDQKNYRDEVQDSAEIDTFENNLNEILNKIIPTAVAQALSNHNIEFRKGKVEIGKWLSVFPGLFTFTGK